jgi:oxygen-independent coproporphyrinogen-3 oxidase
MIKTQDYLFKEMNERIAKVDLTGYTFQYPPMIFWRKVKEEEVKKAWKHLSIRAEEHLGMYVHLPFCKTRCSFCRYFSNKLKDSSQIDKYLIFLEKEVKIYKHFFGPSIFKTLYIGGGTPSLLTIKQISRLFEMLYNNFDFSKCRQVVFEGNTDFLEYEKLKKMKEYNVNRLTIGIQSLDKRVIKKTNRSQTVELFYKSYQDARKAGIRYINVDLMTGLPFQTLEGFYRTVEEVIKLRADMIHIHPFYPTPRTQFFKDGHRLSKHQMEARNIMNRIGGELLFKAGYKNIKFDSNGLTPLARNMQLSDNVEFCAPFLGLGSGAASHNTGYFRYVNFKDIKKYYRALSQKRVPIYKGYKLNKLDDMIYFVIANLRYGEVSKNTFYKLFRENLDETFGEVIRYLEKRNKVINERFRLISNANNIGEYLIFSKYFFSKDLIDKYKNSFLYSNESCTPVTDEELRYMCI